MCTLLVDGCAFSCTERLLRYDVHYHVCRCQQTNRRQAAAQAQKLLLHYAIVRKIIQHPLQRPLAPVERGLSALPFWRTKTPETEEQLANEAVFPWVAALEDKAGAIATPSAMAAIWVSSRRLAPSCFC